MIGLKKINRSVRLFDLFALSLGGASAALCKGAPPLLKAPSPSNQRVSVNIYVLRVYIYIYTSHNGRMWRTKLSPVLGRSSSQLWTLITMTLWIGILRRKIRIIRMWLRSHLGRRPHTPACSAKAFCNFCFAWELGQSTIIYRILYIDKQCSDHHEISLLHSVLPWGPHNYVYIYIFTGLGIIAVYIIITRGGVLSMPSLSFLLLLL